MDGAIGVGLGAKAAMISRGLWIDCRVDRSRQKASIATLRNLTWE